MKELYKKISLAKKEIKETKTEKKGENSFSKYKYFTPDQIEQLVYIACEKYGLLTSFNLIRNEFGTFGVLSIIDIESGNKLDYQMATAIPEIKATNIAQQLGGCVTYTERYLKMSAFGITDNSLDFDTSENTKINNTELVVKKEKLKEEPKTMLTDLTIAKQEIKESKTIEELNLVIKRWECFWNDEMFIRQGKAKRTELTNK